MTCNECKRNDATHFINFMGRYFCLACSTDEYLDKIKRRIKAEREDAVNQAWERNRLREEY